MQAEYQFLEETIKQADLSEPIHFWVNSGNWGDSLIREGTLRFLNDIGVDYRIVQPNKVSKLGSLLTGSKTALFAGSGSWCRVWNVGQRVVNMQRKRFKHVIVLPSSYELSSPAWSNVTYFRRDQYQSQTIMPGSHFCHDMALYLDSIDAPAGEGVGYFFRVDAESGGRIPLPPNNVDIAAQGNESSPLEPLFERLSRYAVIYTDRLHMAIASALLNREVHLFASSYWKIPAIYQSSLKQRFPKIQFHGDTDFRQHYPRSEPLVLN